MGKLVSIGGGSMAAGATLPIDREIVRAADAKRPSALFIPTASGDPADYCEGFAAIYGGKLGCRVETLLLYRDRPTKSAMQRRIREAELIYVGGGNTLRMMRFWRRLGVDRMLVQAWKRGAVLCGTSAGAICWLCWGNSDSRSFSGKPDWDYIRVRGLGLIDVAGCPHYHGETREASFAAMIGRYGGPGIALNDHTALQVAGEDYRILTSNESGRAYHLDKRDGEVVTRTLTPSRRFAPLADLL